MDRLSNTVRPYAWGSTTAIPELLGTAPTGEPQAEMWMGAHPGAPSRINRPTTPVDHPLSDLIAAAPEAELGAPTVKKFGPRLPFLLKILPPAPPLPPGPSQPRPGEGGLCGGGAPGRPHRRAAPQLQGRQPQARTDLRPHPFDGLCGFRAPAETADLLARLDVDSLKPYVDLLRAHPEEAALREVLTAVLTADPDEMSHTVHSSAEAAARIGGEYSPYVSIAHHYPGDPGVIAAMLLNHVQLQPGEALFLGAGVPHAYLNGLGVEIMANSDNVLRCGLTPKHVDVPELLRIVRFESADPAVLRPEASASGEELYETPIDEFRLSTYGLAPGAEPRDLTAGTPQILLCTAGTPRANEIDLTPGDSVFVPAGEKTELTGTGRVFRATVIA